MANNRSVRQTWNRVSFSRTASEAEGASDTGPTTCESSTPVGTFIASGASFEGTLSLSGDFHIDTEFRGELETDGTITIGLRGSVVGRIRAREVVIRGAVVGDVTAPRQLIVESTGKLHGDIETACLEIQKHAFFKGTTSMTQPQTNHRKPENVASEREALAVQL